MSGHSKWATIKRQKGAADNKRGQVFTKLSYAITVAVKQGGGVTDPESNFKLRLAVDRARSANMPKENIERAIEKAKGVGADSVEEFMYEGFAPGGVAVIVQAVTDNKQRTFSTLKNTFDKNGGNLGSPGTVSYLFTKKGEIIVKKNGLNSEELLSKGIEANITDMEEENDSVFFFTDPQGLQQVRRDLEAQGLTVESAQQVFVANTYLPSDQEAQAKVLEFINKVEDLEDVQEVYTNLG